MSCPSDQTDGNRLHRNISPEPVWTPKLVEARLAEAAAVLKRLPVARVRGYFNTWPQYSYEFADLIGQEARETSLAPPSPAAISRMEETLSWTIGLDTIDGKIVWMRADRVPWKAICRRVGLQRSSANERWVYALCVIALQLNGQVVPWKRSRRYVIDRVRDSARVSVSPCMQHM